jgi:benzodiazapine receptor
MRDIIRQITVCVSVAATIVVNILANALPLNGLNTGQISDRFKVYFVPAGYVFSIWGLIYIALIAYAAFQALRVQRERPVLRKTGWLVAASGLANIAWLFLWHYEQFPWTVPVMLVLLGLLIAAYLQLGIGRSGASTAETWCVRIPVSLYLGWITVATVANVTAVLYDLDWDRFGLIPRDWMLIILAVVLVVSGLVSLTRRDIVYNLVIIWALIGIAVKWQLAVPAAPSVVLASIVTAVGVAAVLVFSVWRQRKA